MKPLQLRSQKVRALVVSTDTHAGAWIWREMHAKTTQHPSVCNRPSISPTDSPHAPPHRAPLVLRERTRTKTKTPCTHTARFGPFPCVTHERDSWAPFGCTAWHVHVCVPVQLLKIPSHDTNDRSRGRGFNKKEREIEKKKPAECAEPSRSPRSGLARPVARFSPLLYIASRVSRHLPHTTSSIDLTLSWSLTLAAPPFTQS